MSQNRDEERQELLRSYVERLSAGEDLEQVRKDFVANFKDVDASEIMKAEQALMQAGVSYQKVQKLCDVHSALFHGATSEEKIAVSTAAERQAPGMGRNMRELAKSQLQKLAAVPGHPLSVFMKEDDAIEAEAGRVKELLEKAVPGETSMDAAKKEFRVLRAVSLHYAAKGDLIYPLLKSKHDVSGPSDVMWGVDDEIRAEIRNLSGGTGAVLTDEQWKDRALKLITRVQEMIYKERNILYPICIQNLTRAEWVQMAMDLQDYEPCLIERQPLWKLAENAPVWKDSPEWRKTQSALTDREMEQPGQEAAPQTEQKLELQAQAAGGAPEDDEVVFPSGHLTKSQLTAMLDTIPGEISFIDADDINRYFNRGEGPKAFKRPLQALDREVYYCHPPKVEEMVRMIITSFKEGKRDSVDVWTEKNGHTYLVRYMAVRDKQGAFVGSMEYVQNMDAAKEHFAKSAPKNFED
ncbi:MAG: DUF438 domain-containing protein [Lachnospiraceae bacterium]|nr:DUF438 domain-containing protein [Lachnospiraceae bacterium]